MKPTLMAAAGAVVLLTAGAAGYAYWKLNSNIRSVDINRQLGTARPPASTDGSSSTSVKNARTCSAAGEKTIACTPVITSRA